MDEPDIGRDYISQITIVFGQVWVIYVSVMRVVSYVSIPDTFQQELDIIIYLLVHGD